MSKSRNPPIPTIGVDFTQTLSLDLLVYLYSWMTSEQLQLLMFVNKKSSAAVLGLFKNVIKSVRFQGGLADYQRQRRVDKMFTLACMKGALALAKALFPKIDPDKYTHVAVVGKHVGIIKLFIDNGNVCGILEKAIRDKAEVEWISSLLEDKDLNRVTGKDKNITPLTVAVFHGHLDLTLTLLSRGARFRKADLPDLLSRSARKSDIRLLRLICDTAKDDVRHVMLASEALFEATEEGCLENVKELIARGAGLICRNNLHIAINDDTLKYLYNAITRQHFDSVNCILDLAKAGDLEMYQLLLNKLLFHAVCRDAPLLRQQLLERGAEANYAHTDPLDHTNIHILAHAIINLYDISIVSILLEHGALVRPGAGLLHHACENIRGAIGHNWNTQKAAQAHLVRIIQKLIEHGFDINEQDENGKTILFVAVEKRQAILTAALLELGADKDLVDNQGRTPMDVSRCDDIKNLLKSRHCCLM